VTEHDAAGDLADGRLQSAEADLSRVRDSLAAATRGDLDAAELPAALRTYLDQHGPTLRAAATAVGEEVRRQLLEQLYAWRAQLESQLGSRPPPRPDQAGPAA
jgi:hypothetical protein